MRDFPSDRENDARGLFVPLLGRRPSIFGAKGRQRNLPNLRH